MYRRKEGDARGRPEENAPAYSQARAARLELTLTSTPNSERLPAALLAPFFAQTNRKEHSEVSDNQQGKHHSNSNERESRLAGNRGHGAPLFFCHFFAAKCAVRTSAHFRDCPTATALA